VFNNKTVQVNVLYVNVTQLLRPGIRVSQQISEFFNLILK